MEKETFAQYAKIKHQIKELTAEAKELEPEIVSGMVELGVDKVKTEFGGFTLTTRKTWSYSEKVTALEEQVKVLKAQEESGGVATFEEKKGLMFK